MLLVKKKNVIPIKTSRFFYEKNNRLAYEIKFVTQYYKSIEPKNVSAILVIKKFERNDLEKASFE